MQTVDELRQRLPAPTQVHIGPQATLVMDVGRVQLQVRLCRGWHSARSMLRLSSCSCPAFADELKTAVACLRQDRPHCVPNIAVIHGLLSIANTLAMLRNWSWRAR